MAIENMRWNSGMESNSSSMLVATAMKSTATVITTVQILGSTKGKPVWGFNTTTMMTMTILMIDSTFPSSTKIPPPQGDFFVVPEYLEELENLEILENLEKLEKLEDTR